MGGKLPLSSRTGRAPRVAGVTASPLVRRHDAWSAEELIAAKRGRGVSVVIPARDEAASIGAVVAGIRAAWAGTLVDEIVVIDSDSQDDTHAVAVAAGAKVFRAKDIRPDLGAAQGKGEALWKSLHVVRGDLLAFVDADLVDWGPHFVSGLLGPLLTDPDVMLVKAVYDRPMLDADGREAEAGGRVTELVARPMLALHWPQLAALVQPLSGEWAIRRSVLEGFTVPRGYGVEIAAVIDTAAAHGPDAIAQVDLGRRTHRNRRHDTLGPMAVQVLAAAEARLGLADASWAPAPVSLVQFDRTATGFTSRVTHPDIGERPPARSVVDYRTEVESR